MGGRPGIVAEPARSGRSPSRAPSRPIDPFPERMGRYELLLPIGTGGMATVFLARASGIGGFERDVAIKIIHAHLRGDEDCRQHLMEEARLAARIRHPNVVPVLEVSDDPYGVYLVLDYVEGDTLAGLMREVKAAQRQLPLPIVARILLDALAGLHAAHELKDSAGHSLGLVHRDFSPQNILIGVDGVSRLADFSVAKTADRAVRTHTGLVKGKIGYMSPEQARGRPLDRRCDVWAAGVVAWELIAWRRLHKSEAVSTLLAIVTEEPPRLGSVVPGMSKALEDVVARALAMDPTERTPSALELRQELDRTFRSMGSVADTREVSDFMRAIFGPKLRERQARVSEIRQLRERMGAIVQAPDSAEGGSTPLGRSSFEVAPESGERTVAAAPAVLAARDAAAHPRREALFVSEWNSAPTVTESVDEAPPDVPLRSLRGVVAASLAAACLGAIAYFGATSASPPPGDPGNAREVGQTRAPSPEGSQPSSGAERPDPLRERATGGLPAPPDTSAPERAIAPPTRGAYPTTARSPLRRSIAPAPETAPRIAAPSSRAPTKLARDPYGEAR